MNVAPSHLLSSRLQRVRRGVRSSVATAWRVSASSLVVIVMGTLLQSALVPVALWLTGKFVDAIVDVHQQRDTDTSLVILALCVTAFLVRTLGTNVERAHTLFSERVSEYVRTEFLQHVADSDPALRDDESFRDQLQRAQSDLVWRPHSMVQTLLWLLGACAALLGVFVVIARVHPMLLLLGVLATVPHFVVRFIVNHALFALYSGATARERLRDYYTNLVVGTDTAHELATLGALPRLARRAGELGRARVHDLTGIHRRGNALDVVAGLVSACILFLAYRVMLNNNVAVGSAGDAAVVVASFQALTAQAAAILAALSGIEQHARYLEDLAGWQHNTDAQHRLAASRVAVLAPMPLQVRQLTLTYPQQAQPALVDVDLDAAPGQWLAVVGETGAGKSTLLRALLGLYPAQSGHIHLGEQALEAMPRAQRLAQFACVFQDFARLQLPLCEQLALAIDKDQLDDDDVVRARAALTTVGLSAWLNDAQSPRAQLSKPVGRVFADGHELSGGQWQRLALARLLLRDAPVLLLDEPTAHLDPHSESQVLQALRKSAKDRVVVVVTHRRAVVTSADRVVVLQQGRVVQAGAPAALLSINGPLRDLFGDS